MLKIFLIPLLVLTAAGCATHAATSGRVVVRDDGTSAELRFQEGDRAVVKEYYRAAKAKKKPALVKRERLPAGLAKGDTLPPSLHGRPLPGVLEARLQLLPGAYARLIIGRDMVLMHRNTRLVLDILYGVVD